MAAVVALFTCPNQGQPMQQCMSVEARAGYGLVGDRYATDQGAFSQARRTVRHVSLIAAEAMAEANQELLKQFLPEETRRNILTQGVDLNSLVGKMFTVGLVQMRGVELCDPCDRPSKLAGKPGFKHAFDQRGGLRAELLTSGVIAIGDSVTVIG